MAKHLINEQELSLIYQMAENIRGIRDHADHPDEVLSVILVYITSVLYRGSIRDDGYKPNNDALKMIADYQSGGIPTFKDLLVKLGAELAELSARHNAEGR